MSDDDYLTGGVVDAVLEEIDSGSLLSGYRSNRISWLEISRKSDVSI
jgi:hypothetical protein